MSWLARSIANTLKLDEDENGTDKAEEESDSPNSPHRGVKEDLSELSETLTRNFWGVASFLAPPGQSERRSRAENLESDDDPGLGIRADFAEIGGRFKSGISQISSNINVSEITKMASSFLQLGSDDEGEDERNIKGFEGAVGVTEEVVSFVRDVTMHPETWLDFPLPENDGHGDDDDDFDLSDIQQEHALAVERLVPRLAALRIELCPGYMGESCFWKIYFVLIHPRLDEKDAELLSTPEIVNARASLAKELKNRTTTTSESSTKKPSDSHESDSSSHEEPLSVPSPDPSEDKINKGSNLEGHTFSERVASETVMHPAQSNEVQLVDKSPVKEKHGGQVEDQRSISSDSSSVLVEKDGDDVDDDWLKEDSSGIEGTSGTGTTNIHIENEDDVSFSDLEEDD